MSMNFSEFKQALGADPKSQDPEFLRARESSEEFAEAAREAEVFEQKLEKATTLPMPEGLLQDILNIPGQPTPIAAGRQPVADKPVRRRWIPLAAAASLLVAVGAASLVYQNANQWETVEEYLADHYRYDGHTLEHRSDGSPAGDAQALLADLGVSVENELSEIISVIKYCPTPDGKGAHMVLNTQTGPVTLIYMPGTEVTDQQDSSWEFSRNRFF